MDKIKNGIASNTVFYSFKSVHFTLALFFGRRENDTERTN